MLIKIFRVITFFVLIYSVITIGFSGFAQDREVYLLADTVIANEYLSKAKILAEKAKYDSSNIYYNYAVKIFKQLAEQNSEMNLWMPVVYASNAIGWNVMMLGKYDSSLTLLEMNLELGKSKLGKIHSEVAQTYNNMGTVYWYDGKYDKALEMHENSLSIKSALFGEASQEVAGTYINLGLTYHKKGDYDKALEMYQTALNIGVPIYGENNGRIAANYNNIGNVYLYKGDYDKALDNQLKALSIRLNVYGEEHPTVASSYTNIGIIYGSMGDYDKEIEFYQRALSIRLNLLGEKHPDIALVYGNIGTVYENKKDFNKALEYFNKALSIRLNLTGEDHPSVALLYNNMGESYRALKDLEKSFELLNKSLALRLKLMGSNHPDVAITYGNIGQTYFDSGDYQASREYFVNCYKIWSSLFGEKHPEVGLAYYNIARSYKQQNNFDSSLVYCQKSLISLVIDFEDTSIFSNPVLDNINSELNLLKTLKLKADIFSIISNNESTEQLEYSLLNYQLASNLADMIRIGFKAEGSKFLLGDQTSDLYSNAMKTSLRLFSINEDISKKEQAFNFIEKSKSAVLQEGLLESKARQFANLPQSVLDDEKEIKKDISFYKTQLEKELQKKDQRDSIKILEYQNRLFSLNQSYDVFVQSIEKNYPAYYDLKYQTRAITISEIQKQLDAKTALLQYFVGDSSIYIASVTNENLEILELKKPDDFAELVRTYYSAIIKSENEKYISSSNKITDLLITPVLNSIKSKDRLVIIPHDILFKLPFEALFTKPQSVKAKDFTKLNYLITDFEISYHYSATLFVGQKEKEKKTASKNFIGFAPVFPKDDLIGYTISSGNQTELLALSDEVVRSLSIDGKTFDELKYSEWEVNSIIDLFVAKKPKQINTAYFYSDAKEDSFKSNVNDYKIVHIASHSFMNEVQPDISGIIFSQPTDSSFSNDGILYASETYNLDLNADLVVLSSCESGLGKLFKGEGMIALTRGFLYSGTSNILFSLWKIPDKHTSELMVEFYRQMISGKSYSESLRQAKLKLIKNEVTARPRSWAGFLLIGSD